MLQFVMILSIPFLNLFACQSMPSNYSMKWETLPRLHYYLFYIPSS